MDGVRRTLGDSYGQSHPRFSSRDRDCLTTENLHFQRSYLTGGVRYVSEREEIQGRNESPRDSESTIRRMFKPHTVEAAFAVLM